MIQNLRTPRMTASAKQVAFTLCLIGLMARSACAASEMLDTEEQEFVHVSNRRLLLPRIYNIYQPAPPPSPAPASYAPSPSPAPAPYAPSPPTANYAEPPSPAPEESNVAPPAPPSSMESDTTSFEIPNQDASVTVNCGDRLCAGIWIGSKRIMVIKYE